ncbi:dienelactone hydrolase family protein [Nitrospirillum sp. BR 11163]|uniref:carboxylesterase family protein n=1 Tax=Nitrospirillum sp. BR 11163 TaxID=3104323 RepID=UPI002AFE6A54|nr:alpha/beta hydrolase-fold protein [Nitrospirillum sp. BR 11163]MEA1673054.1 alpha/beta hydrolase-fold protein [Nitrospirillum sp. BR 11163]
MPRTGWVALSMMALASAAQAEAGRIEERTLPYAPLPADLQAVEEVIRTPLSDDFAAKTYTAPDGRAVPYRLLVPATVVAAQPALVKLPLVVVLHGSGSIGHDNAGQMTGFAKAWALPDLRRRFPAYVVVPQVDARSADYAPGEDGLLASHPGVSLPAVLALVDDLAGRLPVDTARIYVVGFSMGASAALDALVAKPGRFAAAVAFSAVPPDRARAAGVAGVPTLQVHGDQDRENPYAPDHAWAEAVAAAGGAPVFVRYQGMEHRVPPDMILAPGWREWLFAQRLNPAIPPRP